MERHEIELLEKEKIEDGDRIERFRKVSIDEIVECFKSKGNLIECLAGVEDNAEYNEVEISNEFLLDCVIESVRDEFVSLKSEKEIAKILEDKLDNGLMYVATRTLDNCIKIHYAKSVTDCCVNWSTVKFDGDATIDMVVGRIKQLTDLAETTTTEKANKKGRI